ncbi:hypothetical protein IQ247_23245 [Plectonema cf. radiosum LEGE 06105]|uniref:Uncharacterized protein n=1 Tax=Plectonema cf. radiosum LEGE 06105 TaxID=945769 RepID=A0A8J7JWE2_9CYAN|nr:hypothetical protein [Plectonema radiosum]MBE9215545.1 hypothetical protein [Plectonema cf. radiosum LEGE 06105]
MRIILELKPEVETRLVAHAAAMGMSVERYLESLVEKSLSKEEAFIEVTIPQEKWKAALNNLGRSPSLAQTLPLSDEAISRESIYTREDD